MSRDAVVLDLPLPPTPNDAPRHPMERVQWKNRTRREVWRAAIQQRMPVSDPPERVRMTAHFRLATKPRDFENLVMSLKYVRDALKQRQPEDDPLRWREGLYVDKGFFVDDDPSRCELADVTQETGAEEPGLRVTIEPIEEG